MMSMMGSAISQYGGNGGGMGGVGLAAIIICPIMGTIGGFITGFVYNLVAGWVGGIEMEFDGMDGGDIL